MDLVLAFLARMSGGFPFQWQRSLPSMVNTAVTPPLTTHLLANHAEKGAFPALNSRTYPT